MLRKPVILLAAVVCVVGLCAGLLAAGGLSIYVNGTPTGAQAISYNGQLYVPLQPVARALGLTVKADQASGVLRIGSKAAPKATAKKPPRRAVVQDTVHITRTGAKYHRAGCRYLSRSDIPIARKDAIAQGYYPCSVCDP